MQRQNELNNWLKSQYPDQPFDLVFAAADADFRRYFRANFHDGTTVIAMDAPPKNMSILPYIKVHGIFQAVKVPQIYAYDVENGFMALEDLGQIPFLSALEHDNREEVHQVLLLEAIDTLIDLQKSSQVDVLPEYDTEILKRELQLFPDWFVAKELGKSFTTQQQKYWQASVDSLISAITRQNQVFVHRDFIVRNLMLTAGKPGVLDFQDALYGPVSYDLVSLLRDAFIEWDEEFVLDLAIRYWQKARAANLPVPEAFDDFYRDFEWMGVQRHLKVAGIFARLYHRDGKDKYRSEIPRFLNYLRKASRRYVELAPLYALLVELVGDEDLETGYTF